MIGSNIKRLRTEKGMTQKALANQLFVSAQAVSRWENNEVEPSLGTIAEMAKIFGVSTDVILGVGEPSGKPEPEVVVEKEYIYKEAPKQVIALCEQCNAPLHEPREIVRVGGGSKIICKACDEKNRIDEENKKKRARELRLEIAYKRRIRSFVLGGIAAVVWILGGFAGGCFNSIEYAAVTVLLAVMLFCYISCFILRNNFLGDMSLEILSWGFVRLPGLIFEFSIDGCLWLIGMKILFWVLGIGLAILAALLSFAIGMLISVFIYPYAIIKNITNPESAKFNIKI